MSGVAPKAHQPLPWRGTRDGGRTWSSPQWTAFTGQSSQDSGGLGWLDAIPPADRDAVREAWKAADPSGMLLVDHRIQPAEGPPIWFRSAAVPSGEDNAPWSGASMPIDDLKSTLDRKQELLAALQHRVRNTLGKIRTMARATLRPDQPASDFAAELDGRIAAIARIQAGLISNPLDGTDLALLVAGELASLVEQEGKRVSIDGPPLRLRGRAAETFGLALHELATNAMRHGALAGTQGRIEVAWRIVGTGESALVAFHWRETGLPSPRTYPEHRGFGFEVLETVLRYDLGATTTMMFEPAGLHAVVELPLSRNVVTPGP